jgi:hypothetical protein
VFFEKRRWTPGVQSDQSHSREGWYLPGVLMLAQRETKKEQLFEIG